MHERLIYIAIIFLFTSCQSHENDSKNKSSSVEKSGSAVQETDSFESYFKSDSTLMKRDAVDVLAISNGSKTEEILAICNCDKNIEENTIKIQIDRKSTRLNSSHVSISYAVFCLKKKKKKMKKIK